MAEAPQHTSRTKPSDIRELKARVGYETNPHHNMCATCEHFVPATPAKRQHCGRHDILTAGTARCNDYDQRF